MPRLRNATTGSVVNVSDETAAKLRGYVVADKAEGDKPKARKRASASPKSDDE